MLFCDTGCRFGYDIFYAMYTKELNKVKFVL
jgi:hypothetical protein